MRQVGKGGEMTDIAEIEISCVFVHKTNGAILIKETEDHEESIWIPISQISDCDKNLQDLKKGDFITITIPEWLAEEKELM